MNVGNVQTEEQKKKVSPYYLNASLPKYKSCFDLDYKIIISLHYSQQDQQQSVNKTLINNYKDKCLT